MRTHLAGIQKKKEELYSLITKLDSAFPNRLTRANTQLAIELSVQVKPKPNDPQWYVRSASNIHVNFGLLVFS